MLKSRLNTFHFSNVHTAALIQKQVFTCIFQMNFRLGLQDNIIVTMPHFQTAQDKCKLQLHACVCVLNILVLW